jgi:hypothetical protein
MTVKTFSSTAESRTRACMKLDAMDSSRSLVAMLIPMVLLDPEKSLIFDDRTDQFAF